PQKRNSPEEQRRASPRSASPTPWATSTISNRACPEDGSACLRLRTAFGPHRNEEEQMGLFDFVRDIGRKIFDSDADANDKIRKEIEASLKGVEIGRAHA